MDWEASLAPLLDGAEELDVAELAAVLEARGAGPAERRRDLDGRILDLGEERLRAAAVHPGLDTLAAALETARQALLRPDHASAPAAERAFADVLDRRDSLALRVRALRALERGDLAVELEALVARLDEAILAEPWALGDVSWMREDVVATRADPEASIWRQVPASVEVEPSSLPGDEALGFGPPGDEELGGGGGHPATPVRVRGVAAAVASDPEVRRRYDEVLEDLEAFAPPPELAPVVPMRVRARRDAAAPVKAAERLAASDLARAPYADPPLEALVHAFADDAALYAQPEGERWVLLLYAEPLGEGDGIEGAVVEAWREEAPARLVTQVEPGPVTVCCRGETRLFFLESPLEGEA